MAYYSTADGLLSTSGPIISSTNVPLRNKDTKNFVKWANRREKFFDVS